MHMCGIVGSFGRRPREYWVSAAGAHLYHRGPDNFSTVKLNSQVILGAARLAMTDPLPRSNQPFVDSASGNAIVFNGEIYNYKDLRGKIAEKFHFVTESDTEVLLAGLTLFGTEFLKNLNGMFAFTFFNKESNQIIISRDNLGKKPFYYFNDRGTVNFSSSQKSLKELFQHKKVDENTDSTFLSLGYLLDPDASDSSIHSLLPGEVIVLDASEPQLPEKKTFISLGEWTSVKSFRENLQGAIDSRVLNHQRVAVSLSGGIDSTLVALILAKSPSNVIAFSAAWPDSDKERYNIDSRIASSTARKLGIDFYGVDTFPSNQLESMINKYLEAMEEPNNNSTGLSMLNLYSAIRDTNVRIALTGDGADEILGGYERYWKFPRIPNILRSSSGLLESKAINSGQGIIPKILCTQLSSTSLVKYLRFHLVFSPKEIEVLIPSNKNIHPESSLLSQISRLVQLRKANAMLNFMKFDESVWLSMESNKRLDRVSMKFSVEARSPFQDNIVRAAAYRLMQESEYKVSKMNLLLREFPELSEFEFPKKKLGFVSPIGHWLRSNPTLIGKSMNYLKQKHGYSNSVLNYLEQAPHRGDFQEITKLWTLLVLAQWKMNHLAY